MRTPVLQFLKSALGISMSLAVALSSLLSMPTEVFANSRHYDEDLPPNTKNRSGASRGSCETATPTGSQPDLPSLILFSPQERLGRTAETRPTLAWFVNEPGSWAMEFRLYEYDRSTQQTTLVAQAKDTSFKSSPGIVVFSFADSMPSLSIGKRYLWQVELNCHSNKPSGNPFAEGEFKVVEVTPELKTELSLARNRFERAAIYTKEGLWYDALATVLTTSMTEDDFRLRQLRALLLEKATVEEDEIQQISQSLITQVQR